MSNTSKLIVTRGLQAAGKTTAARAWVTAGPGQRFRINRDDLRRMMFGGWTGESSQENAVTAVQHAAVAALLRDGRSVVADDTSLNERTIEEFSSIAAAAGAELEVWDFTHVSLEECIRRDARRAWPECVGEVAITRMWERYLKGRPRPLPLPADAKLNTGPSAMIGDIGDNE